VEQRRNLKKDNPFYPLSEPGIEFSKEQMKTLMELYEKGEMVKAQKIILSDLKIWFNKTRPLDGLRRAATTVSEIKNNLLAWLRRASRRQ
jgi:hypothetical protein